MANVTVPIVNKIMKIVIKIVELENIMMINYKIVKIVMILVWNVK